MTGDPQSHTQSGWVFIVTKGPISSITESEQYELSFRLRVLLCRLGTLLGLPLPTMTFAHNKLIIRSPLHGLQFQYGTVDALKSISKVIPSEIRLPDAANDFWLQKGASFGCHQPFDWTFWSGDYLGSVSVNGEQCDWQQTRDTIDYGRLASTLEPIRFFDQLDFYEDELADSGCSLLELRFRVMDFGFFVKIRLFLRVDQVLIRCKETRYYHEFNSPRLLREVREYRDPYQSCLQKSPTLHIQDIDEVVAGLSVVSTVTESLNL